LLFRKVGFTVWCKSHQHYQPSDKINIIAGFEAWCPIRVEQIEMKMYKNIEENVNGTEDRGEKKMMRGTE
jgi:hypothetical protein